ncbi:hypothetical protein HELRODRAFT_128626, partial [Helobdella robusta]|uniref:Neurotransmitter-gated ion-channel ligand-binding domain-containing protein n=1 Tax=Helobdella robusta TaxID=6412 RepID=T1EHP2_HELRO
EKLLIKQLLRNYDSLGIVGRPVRNISDVMEVKFGIGLIQLLDLDEKNQILTTNVWGRYSWTDIYMRWDPTQYGGVDYVRVPTHKIWTPDIVLYN